MGSPVRSQDSISSLNQSLHHLLPQAHSILPAGTPISPQQRINSRSEFQRQGELCAYVNIATPPAGQPRGYATPKIRRLKSARLVPKSPLDLLHGEGGGAEARPHTTQGGARVRGEASRSSVSTTTTALSAAHTLNGSTGAGEGAARRPATSASQPHGAVSCHPHPPATAQSARAGGGGRGRNPRLPKFACTMARQRGTRVWQAYAESEWLTSPGRRLRKKLEDSQRGMSYEDVHGGLGRSSALPAAWSPLPDLEEDRDPRQTFVRAAATTGLKYKAPNLASRVGVDRRAEGINALRVQLQYQGSEFVVPKPVWEPPEGIPGIYYRRKKNSRLEKLLGKHMLPRDAKKEGLRVVYSEQYYEVKKANPDETRWKGTGTITEFDPDGLMTNVVWSDSSVEYCCTGYGGLYFLALADDASAGNTKGGKGAAKGGPDWQTEAQLAPKWSFGHKDGLFRVPFQPAHRRIKTLTEIAREVKRLHLKLAMETPGTLAYRDLSREFDLAKHELTELNRDRELMSRTIETSIGDAKFKIPPSALAPTAASALGNKKTSILQSIKKEVRRDAERQRRLEQLEEQTEAERRKLERKAIRNKEYTDQIEHLERRSKLAKMDPWEAIRNAPPEVLNEILKETFTLFDLDNNGAMDAVEFEQALISMGVNAPPHLIQLVIADADRDKNGTLEWQEFKTLAVSMVEAAKVHAEVSKRQRKLEILNARRAAAGAHSVLIKPPDQALVEREKYVHAAAEMSTHLRKQGRPSGEATDRTKLLLFESIFGADSPNSSSKIEAQPNVAPLPSEGGGDFGRRGSASSGNDQAITRRSSTPTKRMLPMPPSLDDDTLPHSELPRIMRTASSGALVREGVQTKSRDVILSLLESSVLGPKEKSTVQARRLSFTIERLSRRASSDASPEPPSRTRSTSVSGDFGRTGSSSSGKGFARSRSTEQYSSPQNTAAPIERRGKGGGGDGGFARRGSSASRQEPGARRKSADSGRGSEGERPPLRGGAPPQRRWSLVEKFDEEPLSFTEQERQLLLREKIHTQLASIKQSEVQGRRDSVGNSRRYSMIDQEMKSLARNEARRRESDSERGGGGALRTASGGHSVTFADEPPAARPVPARRMSIS